MSGIARRVGRYVDGLHKDLAGARIGELLSHGAGVTRDGADSGQFLDRRPFLSRAELLVELSKKQPLAPGIQLKYSNHGYGLLGLMIEEVTRTAYPAWITRNVIEAAGLQETVPDMAQLRKTAPMAKGHSAEFPFGQRLVVPGDNVCDAIAPAGGFVSTASDVARFFAQLAPDSKESILSPASRRDMMQRRWRERVVRPHGRPARLRVADSAVPGHRFYRHRPVQRARRRSLPVGRWHCQHPGGVQGARCADQARGAVARTLVEHVGRKRLVPMGKVVCQVAPALNPPFDGATTECAITGKDSGVVTKTSGYNSPGQAIRLVRDSKGVPAELWVGGSQLLPEEAMVAEAMQRYRKARRATDLSPP